MLAIGSSGSNLPICHLGMFRREHRWRMLPLAPPLRQMFHSNGRVSVAICMYRWRLVAAQVGTTCCRPNSDGAKSQCL